MSADDTTSAYIIDTQIAIFDDARLELQLTIAEIARQARLGKPTVDAWAQGRNGLTLWGLKKLLRVKGLAPYLSRLFEPEEFALVGYTIGTDHDDLAEKVRDWLAEKDHAHHPESEAGREIGPGEDSRLRSKFAVISGGIAA